MDSALAVCYAVASEHSKRFALLQSFKVKTKFTIRPRSPLYDRLRGFHPPVILQLCFRVNITWHDQDHFGSRTCDLSIATCKAHWPMSCSLADTEASMCI